MKPKKKNKKTLVQKEIGTIDSSKNRFLYSWYFPYLIPLLYFVIFGFIIMTNRIFFYGFLQRFNFNFGKVKLFTLIILLLTAINFTTSYNAVSRQLNNVPLGILETANWMKSNYKEDLEGKTIMGRAPHIAYYLDMNFEVIPYCEVL